VGKGGKKKLFFWDFALLLTVTFDSHANDEEQYEIRAAIITYCGRQKVHSQ